MERTLLAVMQYAPSLANHMPIFLGIGALIAFLLFRRLLGWLAPQQPEYGSGPVMRNGRYLPCTCDEPDPPYVPGDPGSPSYRSVPVIGIQVSYPDAREGYQPPRGPCPYHQPRAYRTMLRGYGVYDGDT